MILTYNNLSKKPANLKSATGLSKKEFDFLHPTFDSEWESYISCYTFEGKLRQRSRGYRKDNTFKSSRDMLVFVLYDYRHNPTQEYMGLHFKMPQPKVAMWLKVLEPVLLNSLSKLGLTPVRDSDSLDGRLIASVAVLLDGSERPINRPKYEQEEYYSGKKSNIR